MDLDPGTPQNLEIVLPSQADVLERTDVTTNMNGPEPSVEPTKPSREEVDWETLKRSEVSEQQDPLSNPVDVTFLRQRLERQNPLHRASSTRLSQVSTPSRRSSLQQIRRSVVDIVTCEGPPTPKRHSGLGHSRNESKEILLTDLELWTALVSDYTRTAIRLPILTSRKIRAGVPQPLRGLVWQAMSGARDTHLEGLYETLSVESTPFEKVIGRDLARTFPQVEMFKREDGPGQTDLGKVLRAFSLYDGDVGYCQGLGFIVAPLLMNMTDSEAFCVLVRMMEGYELRSMFTPTLSGLKLRLYQFEQLLNDIAPVIAAHLRSLDIFPAMYVSQWFLSLFAVTCPLETLHRIYDLILSEGGPETMMRLSLTLLIKNQELIMTLDMEEILHLLLSSDLWAAYNAEDDLLINDVVSFTTSITSERLIELEKQYENNSEESPATQVKGLQSIASSFLGRINPSRLFSGSYTVSGVSEGTSAEMARTSSKASTTTIETNSARSSSTENAEASSNSSFSRSSVVSLKKQTESLERENRQLNQQIEDLIEALTEAHRQVAVKKEKNDKSMMNLDDLKAVCAELLDALAISDTTVPDPKQGQDLNQQAKISHWASELSAKLEAEPLSAPAQLSIEKIKFLESQLDDRNSEVGRMRGSLQSVKIALDATQKEKARLEKALSEARQQRKDKHQSDIDGGMREFKLARSAATSRSSSQTRLEGQSIISKGFRRASTFTTTTATSTTSPSDTPVPNSSPDLVSKEQHPLPAPLSIANNSNAAGMTAHEEEVDSLRLELVQAKAAIAIAQQDAEESRYALKMLRNANIAKTHVKRISVTRAETAPAAPETPVVTAATTAAAVSTAQAKASGTSITATATPRPAFGAATSWLWGRK